MPRYYRTFLATGLLAAMTLPAAAQTPAPATAPESVSPAPTPLDSAKVAPKASAHHVTHRHHVAAVRKTPSKAPAPAK